MKKLILSIGLMFLAIPLFAAGIDSVHPSEISSFIQTHHPLIDLFRNYIILAPCYKLQQLN